MKRILDLDDLRFMEATVALLDIIFEYNGPPSTDFHVEGKGHIIIRPADYEEGESDLGGIEVDYIEDGRPDIIMRCHYRPRVARRIKRHIFEIEK